MTFPLPVMDTITIAIDITIIVGAVAILWLTLPSVTRVVSLCKTLGFNVKTWDKVGK
jgi:hypothetical protein